MIPKTLNRLTDKQYETVSHIADSYRTHLRHLSSCYLVEFNHTDEVAGVHYALDDAGLLHGSWTSPYVNARWLRDVIAIQHGKRKDILYNVSFDADGMCHLCCRHIKADSCVKIEDELTNSHIRICQKCIATINKELNGGK